MIDSRGNLTDPSSIAADCLSQSRMSMMQHFEDSVYELAEAYAREYAIAQEDYTDVVNQIKIQMRRRI